MDYKNINDYEVLYMIKENNDYAQDIMYKKYLPIIKKISSKYAEFIKNKGAEYEDLVQEGTIGLASAIRSYKDNLDTLFYTYACLCIERQISVFCRNISSKKHEILNDCIYDDNNLIDQKGISIIGDPEKHSMEYSDYKEFIRCKNHFDLKSSCIFELRYNGFTYKEISKLLDLPISTVDGRLFKIRRTLHRLDNNLI